MSVFDINQQMWKHIELESFVITGFRLDLEKGLGCAQMACLLLDTNEVYLFNPLEVQNEEDEVVH